jgi:hypothetical protein
MGSLIPFARAERRTPAASGAAEVTRRRSAFHGLQRFWNSAAPSSTFSFRLSLLLETSQTFASLAEDRTVRVCAVKDMTAKDVKYAPSESQSACALFTEPCLVSPLQFFQASPHQLGGPWGPPRAHQGRQQPLARSAACRSQRSNFLAAGAFFLLYFFFITRCSLCAWTIRKGRTAGYRPPRSRTFPPSTSLKSSPSAWPTTPSSSSPAPSQVRSSR